MFRLKVYETVHETHDKIQLIKYKIHGCCTGVEDGCWHKKVGVLSVLPLGDRVNS